MMDFEVSDQLASRLRRLMAAYCYAAELTCDGEFDAEFEIGALALKLAAFELEAARACGVWAAYCEYLLSEEFMAAAAEVIALPGGEGETYELRLKSTREIFEKAMRRHSEELAKLYSTQEYRQLLALLRFD